MFLMNKQPVVDQDKKIFAEELSTFNLNQKQDFFEQFRNKIDDFCYSETIFINHRAEMLQKLFKENNFINNIGIIIEPDSDINIKNLRQRLQLKQQNEDYTIIVSHELLEKGFEELTELADIVKINFGNISSANPASLTSLKKNRDLKLMAYNLKDREDFLTAKNEGYDLFQGDFYLQPIPTPRKNIPALKFTYMNLLQELNRPEPNFTEIEKTIKNDVSLSYNLFRLINSAYFGIKNEVKSIKQALALLGMNEFKKWVSLKIMRGLTEDKPGVVMLTSLTRAKFLENLAPHLNMKERQLDMFMLGLFSLIDTFLNRPMEKAIERLSLAEDIKKALLNYEGKMGQILKMIIFYEKGEWEQTQQIIEDLNLSPRPVVDSYCRSIIYTIETIKVLED